MSAPCCSRTVARALMCRRTMLTPLMLPDLPAFETIAPRRYVDARPRAVAARRRGVARAKEILDDASPASAVQAVPRGHGRDDHDADDDVDGRRRLQDDEQGQVRRRRR